jgi:(4-(4-[2-(gamma-L-glutamylamino)ethyl]phenoxymethyl)furan-2-yl)methanamine synthase
LVNVLGFDIGGANVKAAFIKTENCTLQDVKVAMEYFPVWRDPEKLSKVLLTLKKCLGAKGLDALGVTMTAELSDAYQTKREGVCHILACVKEAFPEVAIYILNSNAELKSLTLAEKDPLGAAAANWAATGWIVGQRLKDCVVVDVGSTSASIIPILNWQVAARGKTDLDKLLCGELVYTGSLRTNVAAIVQSIPVKNGVAGVASELFALSGDVHLALGNITTKEYTSETADGRGKSLAEALARLARVVCADMEMLTQQEIINMAKYIYENQILQVAKGLNNVYSYTEKQASNEVPVVVTGLGKDFIAKKAAEKIGVKTIIDLVSLMQTDVAVATPAFGVALMTAIKLEGENVKWNLQ